MIAPSNYNEVDKSLKNKKETKKYIKTHRINIDSNNRQKIIKLITEPISGSISTNGLTLLSRHRIQVYHPNHKMQPSNKNIQVILEGVEGDYKNDKYLKTIGGIPLNYINYNKTTGFPIHTIKIIPTKVGEVIQKDASTGLIQSDYYIISIKDDIQTANLNVGSTSGGSNMSVLKILDTEAGYKYASHFKISLGETFKNIISVRLTSIELSNTQLAIRNSKPILNVDDNLVKKGDFDDANDTIYWINENDKTTKYNVSLVSDNRMNGKIIMVDNTSNITTAQSTQGAVLTTFLSDNSPNVYFTDSDYNTYTNWANNFLRQTNNVFFGYIKTTYLSLLGTQILNENDVIISAMTDKSIPITSANVFLNSLNGVSTIGDFVTFFTNNMDGVANTTIVGLIEDGESPPVLVTALVDDTIMKMLHVYLNRVRDLYTNYNYYNTTSIKTYGCYWEILETINNSNYYIDTTKTTTLGNIKLTPMSNGTTDTYKIIPSRALNSVVQYTLYPIYKIVLKQGTYSSKTFITETEKKFNQVQLLDYNYNTQKFEPEVLYNKLNLKIKDKYHDFKITLDNDNNICKFNQYEDAFVYTVSDKETDDDQGPFILNDQYTDIFINHKGHGLKTGDIIYIYGSTKLSNISASEINKEHVIKVNNVYKCYLRLMIAIPDNSLLQSSGRMDETTNRGEYYFHYGIKNITYATYKSGNAPNFIGSQLLDNTINIFKKNELISKIGSLERNDTPIARVCSITNCDANGNYEISYTLLSNDNFSLGDVLVSSETNSIAMIIPRSYGEDITSGSHEIGLPSEEELALLTSDITLVNNISHGYSIKSITNSNKTSLTGLGGTNVYIKTPVSFSLLFSKNNSSYKALGFTNDNTEFSKEHSNTIKINEAYIDYSYLDNNTSNNTNDRNLLIKTKSNTNFLIGSNIYIDNHLYNHNIILNKPNIELQVSSYEPFSVWLSKMTIEEKTSLNTWLNANVSSFYNPDTGGSNSITASTYYSTRTIVYYIAPYTKEQKQDIGNLGNSINQFADIDYYDYNLETTFRNIYGIKKNEYIYLYKGSKKQRDLSDLSGDGITTGIPDGFYKVLDNLKTDLLSSFFPHINKSINAIVIDYEYTDTYSNKVSYGYINRGFMRSPSINTEIVGYNKTHTTTTTTLSVAKTAGTKLITIPRADATNFSKGFIIILNGLYIDNSSTFIDNKYSRNNISTIESNTIVSVDDDDDDANYSIIRCTYDLLYAHSAGETIYKHGFLATLSESVSSGASVIKVIENTENTANMVVGKIVRIDWNKQVSSMTSAQTQFYIEDVNYISSVSSVSGNIEITLKYSLINSHSLGINVVAFSDGVENNSISTQLVYIDDNWYTRVFYNGLRTIYDRQYDGSSKIIPSTSNNIIGHPYLNPFLTNNIFIDNNSGYYIPHTNLISSNIADTTIDIITPIPPDLYDTYTYNDEDTIYKNTNTSIAINGIFINDLWNNDSDISGYDYYFNFNSITILGKYNGFSGTISKHHNLEDNYINYHRGFIVKDIETITENSVSYDILQLDLSSKYLNINPPNNLITPLLRLTDAQSRNYKVGYGGTIYQRQISNTVNVEGDKYIYLSIKQLDNIITNQFTKSQSAFAKIALNSKIGQDIFNSFIPSQKQFTDGVLPQLNEIEVKFFNDNGKLYDFNNQEVSFTLEIITEENMLDTFNINPNNY